MVLISQVLGFFPFLSTSRPPFHFFIFLASLPYLS
ncbi:hypothetical protein NC651_018460 [Populus alba x Populus x berolinensis]|nr:hypothetical protein NC651_018460 [Populus alba x Populus x berolinensis]